MNFRCLLVIGYLCLPLMVNAAPASVVPPAVLNPQQREWLAQHPQLRVGVVLQAPYAQYDRRLQRLSGANVELMQALAKALNIELTWRNFPTQEQLEDALREDAVDLAPGLLQTPAGLRLWQFSDPYMRVPQHIVGIRDGSGTVDLEKLDEQSRVAVRMAQWFAHGWCQHAIFNLKLPMKKRWQETRQCLDLFADQAGRPLQVRARQLYHDREEITVFATPVA